MGRGVVTGPLTPPMDPGYIWGMTTPPQNSRLRTIGANAARAGMRPVDIEIMFADEADRAEALAGFTAGPRYRAEPLPHSQAGRWQIRDTVDPTAGPHRSGVVAWTGDEASARTAAARFEARANGEPEPVTFTILDGRRHPGRSRR